MKGIKILNQEMLTTQSLSTPSHILVFKIEQSITRIPTLVRVSICLYPYKGNIF